VVLLCIVTRFTEEGITMEQLLQRIPYLSRFFEPGDVICTHFVYLIACTFNASFKRFTHNQG
jgi:hypothetical protein